VSFIVKANRAAARRELRARRISLETEVPQQILKARACVQRIETRVNFEQAKNGFAVLLGLVQFDKRPVIITKFRVKWINVINPSC